MYMNLYVSRTYVLSFLVGLSVCFSLSWQKDAQYTWAKVRPSETLFPTDFNNLGKGYQPPSPRYHLSFFGGLGGTVDPVKNRSFFGLSGGLRSPLKENEIGIEWTLFNHSLTTDDFEGSSLSAGNLALDWSWIWPSQNQDKGGKEHFFIRVGLSVPMGQLKEDDGFGLSSKDVQIQEDGSLILASLYGGARRWMWEPNSIGIFNETGWQGGWGNLALDADIGVAFLYRVMDSLIVEEQNLFVQANLLGGYRSESWALMGGGGYGLALTSLQTERDQAHARVRMNWFRGDLTYLLQAWVPLEPPLGILGGEMIWVAQLGIEGRLP